jgi:hypothetical protein
MFRFEAVVLTGIYWPVRKGSSWPFMLSFRDGRCDAKDGVAIDRQSLLPSELGQPGTARAFSGAATLHVVGGLLKRDTRYRGRRVLLPVTRVNWPA